MLLLAMIWNIHKYVYIFLSYRRILVSIKFSMEINLLDLKHEINVNQCLLPWLGKLNLKKNLNLTAGIDIKR